MFFTDMLQNKTLRHRLRQYRCPDTRKDADKVLPLVTDENVADIGHVFREVDLQVLTYSSDAVDMAVCLVANAAAQGNPAAPDILLDLVTRLRDHNVSASHPDRYSGTWRYRVWDALSLFPDVPAAVAAHRVLDDVFKAQPRQHLEIWARQIGLDIPANRTWFMQVWVPGERLQVVTHFHWRPESEHYGHCRIEPASPWRGARVPVWEDPAPSNLPTPDPVHLTFDQLDPRENWYWDDNDDYVPGPGVSRWQPTVTLDHRFEGPWDLKTLVDDLERATGFPFHRTKTSVGETKGHRSGKAIRAWLTSTT